MSMWVDFEEYWGELRETGTLSSKSAINLMKFVEAWEEQQTDWRERYDRVVTENSHLHYVNEGLRLQAEECNLSPEAIKIALSIDALIAQKVSTTQEEVKYKYGL
jgi:hypothetical protein